MRELPDWIIEGIVNPDVKERALAGKLTSNEKFDVYCYKCKKVLSICLRSKLSIKRIEDKDYKILCKSCALRKNNNIIGKRFSNLTVLEELETKNRRRQFKCKCDCGNECIVELSNLNKGRQKSCGCTRNKNAVEGKQKKAQLTDPQQGDKFGKLTVVGKEIILDKKNINRTYFNCKCECGRISRVSKRSLLIGAVKSCGICNRSYPEWLINIITDEKTLLKIEDKTLTYNDTVELPCEKCGKKFKTKLRYILKMNSGEKTHLLRCMRCKKQVSEPEEEIYNYILSLGINESDIIRNTKEYLDSKKEIDIYIKSKKIGIEYNGEFWHSSDRKEKDYHLKKFLDAKSNGIHLIQIFESEYFINKEKHLKLIKDLICDKEVVFGRKCKIIEISISEARKFFDEYHIQGFANRCNNNIGLYYNNELLSVMGFYKKDDDSNYELVRYATKFGITVLGGADKIIKYFIKQNKPKTILSYSDNSLFTGKIYDRLGFKFSGYTSVNYYWGNKKEVLSREKCQVFKLKEKYPEIYEEAIKENANNKEDFIMKKLNYHKIYKAGNSRWILEL